MIHSGVISPIVQVVAAHQVTSVFQYIVGAQVDLSLKSYDLWTGENAAIDVRTLKRQDCLSCSSQATYPYLTDNRQTRAAVLCGRDTVQLTMPQKKFELKLLATGIQPIVSKLICNEHLLACYYLNHRIVLFKDGRVLVHGTKDIVKAKALTVQLLG